MKYIFTFSVLMVAALHSFAQCTRDSFSLPAPNKPLPIRRVPFNRIVIRDNRFDTTNFRIDQSNARRPRLITFKRPASEEIKTYIEKSIIFLPKDKRTIYIDIKQLRVGNSVGMTHKLFFAADAYVSKNEKLEKIYAVKNDAHVRFSYEHALTKAINRFVVGLCNSYYAHQAMDSTAYGIGDLNNNTRNHWASFPILQADTVANGIFRSFEDFRNNKIDSCVNFSLNIGDDSTYHICLSGRNNYYYITDIWAVSYNNELFIPLCGQYFMPLYKMNNSFYFYVPGSLPDMYTIMSKRFYPVASSSGSLDLSGLTYNSPGKNSGNNVNDARALLIVAGVVVVIVVTAAIIKAIRNKHQQSPQKCRSADMRNCFLDMDTGDIIYY